MAESVLWRAGFALLMGWWGVGTVFAQQLPQLLRPAKVAQERALQRRAVSEGVLVQRSRYVEVNREALVSPSSTRRRFLIEFFPDISYVVEETRSHWSTDGSTYLWMGRIEGTSRGHIVLAVTGEIVSANVETEEKGFYTLRHVEGELHVVEKVEARPPRTGNDTVNDAVQALEGGRAAGNPDFEAAIAAQHKDAEVRTATGDTQIDVLVAYTARVRARFGSTAAVLNNINLAMAEANQSMMNSGVPIEFRLVHSLEIYYPSSDETGSNGIEIALSRLQAPGDGYLDDVLVARDEYGADLVSLWIDSFSGTLGGMAYQLFNPNDYWAKLWAFSVVNYDVALGPSYSFAHELGHNLGLAHDRNNAATAGAYAYAFGYQHTEGNPFRTIMAYPCQNVDCPKINHWSNPSVSHLGNATGVSSSAANSADNAQALRNIRSVAASYHRPGAFFSISGVVRLNGQPLPGVGVYLNGGGRDTNVSGGFLFTLLEAGLDYTLIPSLENYRFEPASVTFTNLRANQTASFTAFPLHTGPVMAFRNSFNAIETNTYPSQQLRSAGGVFGGNPAVSISPNGRAYVVGRDTPGDTKGSVYLNWLTPDGVYGGWLPTGGVFQGNPDVSTVGETAWLAGRDVWNAYWVRSYVPGIGFTPWRLLGGVFATDPAIAGCLDGTVYIVGRDPWGGIWTTYWDTGAGIWRQWRLLGGITQGKPSAACGFDNAVYVAARDLFKGMWLARVLRNNAGQWSFGGGIFDDDVQAIANGTRIHVLGLSFSSPWYRTWHVGGGWDPWWISVGGVLQHMSAAVFQNYIYISGQTGAGDFFWWNTGQWTNLGKRNSAPNSRFSAGPR